jgi:hypothetical protein
MIEFFSELWSFLKSQMPAFILALFQYEEGKIDQKEKEKDAVVLQLKQEQNKGAVRDKYDGVSDLDVVTQSDGDGSSSSGSSKPDA